MEYKKLTSPEFRVTVGDYILTDGIEVECFSSKASHLDWCRVELSNKLQDMITFEDMDEAVVELGYDDDFDVLMEGYARKEQKDYWKEIMIKDDLMKLERIKVKGTFIDCEPQDVIRYILTCGIWEKGQVLDRREGRHQGDRRGQCGMGRQRGLLLPEPEVPLGDYRRTGGALHPRRGREHPAAEQIR